MQSLNPQSQALSMSVFPEPWGEARLPSSLRYPCLLLVQSVNLSFRLESCLYYQIPPAHCMPWVPLTFMTAGKCLVINQNRKDEQGSLAVFWRHSHSEEMDVPTRISINRLELACFSWESWLFSYSEKAHIHVWLAFSVWISIAMGSHEGSGCRHEWPYVHDATYMDVLPRAVHLSVLRNTSSAPGSTSSLLHWWL